MAIITLDGVILEGLLGYANKQIEQAADDEHVKAVVLRINSPGGSITASDDLHRQTQRTAEGNSKKNRPPAVDRLDGRHGGVRRILRRHAGTNPLRRSALLLPAPSACIPSFLNVKKLADHYGVQLMTIKQGQIKASGSPFAEMAPKERQVWQDMVDEAYQRFVQVVEKAPHVAGGNSSNR